MRIKLREFQRHLHKYLDVTVTIVGLGDVVIGTYNPSDSQGHSTDDSQNESKKHLLETTYKNYLPIVINVEDTPEPIKCVRHPKSDALYGGTVYEDGEEKHVFVCRDCYNSQPQKKLFKKL